MTGAGVGAVLWLLFVVDPFRGHDRAFVQASFHSYQACKQLGETLQVRQIKTFTCFEQEGK
jgi:hypothetical protein